MLITFKPTAHFLALARPALLLLLLLLLHAALLQGPLNQVGKALLLGHVGAVLLWQPLIRGEQEFSLIGTAVLVFMLAILGFFISWELLLLWGLALVGILGGKVFHYASLRERLTYWTALVCVLVDLVGLVLPEVIGGVKAVPNVLHAFSAWFVVFACGLIALLGWAGPPETEARAVDVVGALLLPLVVMGVLLGTLAFMFVAGSNYIEALLQALGTMALTLLLLALVWGPRSGFAGLGLEVSRRVLGGGRSFEHWLHETANLSAHEELPDQFLTAAVTHLAEWPGVMGLSWRVRAEDGAAESGTHWLGKSSAHMVSLAHGSLLIDVFSSRALSPTATWQLDLMLRILAQFHLAKQQGRRLQALSFLRAVHETGARTTHEIKNLLQSLDMLSHAVLEDGGRDPVALQTLLGQQLPAIRQRLNEAMLRIRQPHPDDLRPQALAQWWSALLARNAGACVQFTLVGEPGRVQVPAALFDCVADNLLRNALEHGAHVVSVRLEADVMACRLYVSNDGRQIEAERAQRIFLEPLASDSGLGIGLYQAGRLAEAAGYRLTLDENRPGGVSFGLRPKL